MFTWAYPDFWLAAAGLVLLSLLLVLYTSRTRRLSRRLGLGAGRLAWKLPLRLATGGCCCWPGWARPWGCAGRPCATVARMCGCW
ncbi:hypothetical protein [Hymenobacter sp. BRD67]|uniref:hypothetical protein n=1 Tax=Hymenobacter sp. BRD67 TaxID=2675877 RepID=UPI0015643E77|nr:hypothetical protein [Hymenobacter sp. BRD67]QKG53032.1 hypothetical protein GKZ67_10995 [Hymenobacter sp. BRD67]